VAEERPYAGRDDLVGAACTIALRTAMIDALRTANVRVSEARRDDLGADLDRAADRDQRARLRRRFDDLAAKERTFELSVGAKHPTGSEADSARVGTHKSNS
jgi:hypothetical protein